MTDKKYKFSIIRDGISILLLLFGILTLFFSPLLGIGMIVIGFFGSRYLQVKFLPDVVEKLEKKEVAVVTPKKNVTTTNYVSIFEGFILALLVYFFVFPAVLNTASNELSGIATPPYVLIQGRDVTFAFRLIDGSIMRWEFPFDTFESGFTSGYFYRVIGPENAEYNVENYNIFVAWCNSLVQSGVVIDCEKALAPRKASIEQYAIENTIPRVKFQFNGEEVEAYDYSFFVKPTFFQNVIQPLKELHPNDDEKLIQELFNILKQGPSYVYDVGETPRFPVETLTGNGGDCEDTSILMASLLRSVNPQWKVQLVYMDGDNPANPLEFNHVAVFVDTGRYKTMIETTSKGEMNPFENGVTGYFLDV